MCACLHMPQHKPFNCWLQRVGMKKVVFKGLHNEEKWCNKGPHMTIQWSVVHRWLHIVPQLIDKPEEAPIRVHVDFPRGNIKLTVNPGAYSYMAYPNLVNKGEATKVALMLTFDLLTTCNDLNPPHSLLHQLNTWKVVSNSISPICHSALTLCSYEYWYTHYYT